MGVNIYDEYRQALSLGSELRGTSTSGPRSIQHDPGIAKPHLRAFNPLVRFAITIVFSKTKSSLQPGQGIGNILICNVWKDNVRWHRAVVQHGPVYTTNDRARQHCRLSKLMARGVWKTCFSQCISRVVA